MMPRSSGGRINICSTTRKIDVDSRISLRFYSRIAENILKQADIFREEKNIVDLYVMLLRFSSLVMETIPCHRDYRTFPRGSKLYLTKKLKTALSELEELKPAVQAKLQELQSSQSYQLNKQQSPFQNGIVKSSVEWPAIKRNGYGYGANKRLEPVTIKDGNQGQRVVSVAKPVQEHFSKISLSIPRPKEDTLSKHSILGPNGLHGQWQPPINYKVRYPSNADFTPLVTTRDSSIQQSIKEGTVVREEESSSKPENSSLESLVQPKDDRCLIEESDSLISFETEDSSPQPEVIRQPSPPPVLADVQDLIPISTADSQTESMLENASNDASVCAKDPLQLHISTELMNSFMKLAKSNTDRNLETCGVLAGTLRNRKFYITALIIPKQESTSDSCQTTNEEEIFEVQDKQSLFPLGWIHASHKFTGDEFLSLLPITRDETHPTQSCFMSSIDVHTHYSYQIMLPESIAIVMAPRDSSKTHGIFRLTSGGMTVIRQCPRRGFHSHDPPSDGTPIYSHCTDVYMNPGLKFDVIDLR